MRRGEAGRAGWLVLAVLLGPLLAQADTLEFARDGETVSTLSRARLVQACAPRTVEVEDPYYGRAKRFLAVSLACVLEQGFGRLPAAEENVFLRAKDGYARPASGAQLAEPGAWLAFGDADRAKGAPASEEFAANWEPIERRQLEPGPFYLVWSEPGRNDPHRHPWPYQLARIEIAPLADLYPHVSPPGAAADSAEMAGFVLFRQQCIACHAINGEGGKVGPELNVPRSIVEYRPEAQIKAYIRDPQRFRYTTMPAHESLSDADLDALIAYFRAMSRAKHDPGAP